jgi:diguanylate cyclase (GGDEF)-like protein/PAS domain S-box-containing protein
MNVTFMNPVAEKMSGWTQQEGMGQPILSVLHITFGDSGPLMENIHSGDMSRTDIEHDVVLHSRSGGSYDIHYSITPLSTLDGQNIGSVLVIQDVTESRKMLRELSYNASHDALTHLANRVSFEAHLKRLLHMVQETRQRHALVFIDLDRFKAVNDTAGHAAGDALLRELSSLMLSMLRSTDVLARLGGDEFGLLLPDCNTESARYIAGRIISAINDYHFMWDGRLHRIGASAGITLIDADNHQAAEVMSQADIACYASKNSGRGVVTVYEAQQERMQSNRSMMSLDEQWHMIKDNNLVMLARSVASPRIPESSNFWMLSLRLWTSEGEVLEEQAFRAGLAEPELLHALDRRVMQEFFRNFAAPLANKGTGVALPLSLAGLASVTLVDELLEMLEQSPLQARLLHLVVHVEVLNLQDKNSLLGLEKLRCAGCRIVLNYVGRDMDVFNHLNAHMADYLLLDPELVTNVHGNLMDEMLVTIIQGHAQRLGVKTIAGPSNQPVVMDTLSGIGIDYIYGDTIDESRPLELLLNTSYFAIN